jgi:ATP-dependent DNA helicase RecQ
VLQSTPSLRRFTEPQEALEAVFGYREFRPGQRHIIDAVLRGRDCIGVMPTGAGKSLTFQIPAKILPGAVLVISPLISLMKDQVDALVRLGFRAAVLNSSVEWDERQRRLAALRRGELELVYVAPEGLEGSLREMLAGCQVSLVVVDEAHCISQWGHDFRPAYRKLRGLKTELGDIPVLALTATATRRVVGDILHQLGMRKPEGFKGSFYRPNLIITAHKKGQGNTRREILGLIRRHAGESAIVYCMSRRGVESTTAWLCAQGVSALPYHAGLADDVRARNQEAFAREQVDVMVATVAFGMGIDKSNVRLVIHRDMPKSIEAWYQEIGRAGRDGLPSDCVLFYSWADVIGYDAFLADITDETLRVETRRKTVDLFRLVDRAVCRHQLVVAYFDERIDPCGSSCDVCRGVGVKELVAPRPRAACAARGDARDTTLDRASAPRTLRAEVERTAAGERLILPALRAPARGVSRARDVATGGAAVPAGEDDAPRPMELFDRLRALRRRLADAERVPPYIVFSDAVLWQMAERRPRTREQLLALSGVGPVKLERYGDAFLALLREE